MVSDLHRLGYQRLRVMPHEYPLAWRCVIQPAHRFAAFNGALIRGDAYTAPERETPWYSSSQEAQPFGWQDASSDDARALAEKFLARFPQTAAAGKGRDWPYAGWLSELVGFLETGDLLPFVFAEYFDTPPQELRAMPIRRFSEHDVVWFPLPPRRPALKAG
jgi:hypothetical protein